MLDEFMVSFLFLFGSFASGFGVNFLVHILRAWASSFVLKIAFLQSWSLCEGFPPLSLSVFHASMSAIVGMFTMTSLHSRSTSLHRTLARV
jgi:hypothetical protein